MVETQESGGGLKTCWSASSALCLRFLFFFFIASLAGTLSVHSFLSVCLLWLSFNHSLWGLSLGYSCSRQRCSFSRLELLKNSKSRTNRDTYAWGSNSKFWVKQSEAWLSLSLWLLSLLGVTRPNCKAALSLSCLNADISYNYIQNWLRLWG